MRGDMHAGREPVGTNSEPLVVTSTHPSPLPPAAAPTTTADPPSPSATAVVDKAGLRDAAKVRRAEAAARYGTTAGARLATHALGFLGAALAPRATVAGFSAIRDEIDPLPLMLRLADHGHRLALPAMRGRDRPLVFRAWSPGDEMAPAVWGIAEPLATRAEIEPDVVLVPLLAFDAAGARLGYGGGFYDRTLAELRRRRTIVAVGIAYDEQRLDAVPRLDYDQPLDWVLTPSGPLRCG
jgi:5-formyltetrahydrofolate cyclo-ligase